MVTVPEADEPAEEPAAPKAEVPSHTEIQLLPAKIGNDIGIDV